MGDLRIVFPVIFGGTVWSFSKQMDSSGLLLNSVIAKPQSAMTEAGTEFHFQAAWPLCPPGDPFCSAQPNVCSIDWEGTRG